jgi:D-alanyl-lipoteichoic acid acyltransferase DltB (MBOAT superfamily)
MKLILLLIAGYIFYGLFDLKALGILVALSLITYCGGRIAYSYKEKNDNAAKYISAAFIIFEIAVLCFFKYSGLFPMPVGMSFYMLVFISLIIMLLGYLARRRVYLTVLKKR